MGVTLATLDSTPGEVVADVLLVFAAALNAYLGWRHGLLRRLLALAGTFLGCFAATNLGNAIAAIVHPQSLYANAWAFVAIFVFVIIVVEIIGAMFNERLQRIAVAAFDRIGGTLVGAALGVTQVLVLFLVALAVGAVPSTNANPTPASRASSAQSIQNATLSGPAARLEPQLRVIFGPVLPGDLGQHLAQNTVVYTPPV